MRFLNEYFSALIIALLLYRIDKVVAQDKAFKGGVYGGQYGEGSNETGDEKSRKDNTYDIDRYGPYGGGSRESKDSGESRDENERKENSHGMDGPYGGNYDKIDNGRTKDKMDKGNSHGGTYGTYGKYGGSVERRYPTSPPTLEIPEEDVPRIPEYVSPYAQYIPPLTEEMHQKSKEDIPSYKSPQTNQNIPQYNLPVYESYPANTYCQCCPPPPPPPRCTPYCQGPSSYQAPNCGSMFSYQTPGSYQQPHYGYGMRY
jgi:hypothetical protein